ncbi:hypothetical protein ACHAWF_015216, partial [Thalassiosira exigua]
PTRRPLQIASHVRKLPLQLPDEVGALRLPGLAFCPDLVQRLLQRLRALEDAIPHVSQVQEPHLALKGFLSMDEGEGAPLPCLVADAGDLPLTPLPLVIQVGEGHGASDLCVPQHGGRGIVISLLGLLRPDSEGLNFLPSASRLGVPEVNRALVVHDAASELLLAPDGMSLLRSAVAEPRSQVVELGLARRGAISQRVAAPDSLCRLRVRPEQLPHFRFREVARRCAVAQGGPFVPTAEAGTDEISVLALVVGLGSDPALELLVQIKAQRIVAGRVALLAMVMVYSVYSLADIVRLKKCLLHSST